MFIYNLIYIGPILLLLILIWIFIQKYLRESHVPKYIKNHTSKSHKLLTFNIKKFPWSCKSFKRSEIYNLINNHCIILLQECFDETFHSLEYYFPNYYICRGTMKGINLFNSGLAILSKYPIVETEFNSYKNYNSHSLDRFSEKGFLSVLLDIGNGNKLRVINTHLQSSDYERFDKTAVLQLHELLNYTNTLGDKYIIGGDFNIDSNDVTDKIIDEQIFHPNEPTVYIDFTNGNTSNTSITGYEGMTFDYFITSNVSNLSLWEPKVINSSYSDHNPVSCNVFLANSNKTELEECHNVVNSL